METQFQEFPKMARLSREVIITEKIDGTNASIFIYPEALEENVKDPNILYIKDGLTLRAGSRNKYITQSSDNYGFANWAYNNAEELLKLGEGRHFGEWWGSGIQRGYGMKEKVFSLFNVARWDSDELRPSCCRVVPTLWKGNMDQAMHAVELKLNELRLNGSAAAPGFMQPEGIILFHIAGNTGYKKTIDKDELPKTLAYGKSI